MQHVWPSISKHWVPPVGMRRALGIQGRGQPSCPQQSSARSTGRGKRSTDISGSPSTAPGHKEGSTANATSLPLFRLIGFPIFKQTKQPQPSPNHLEASLSFPIHSSAPCLPPSSLLFQRPPMTKWPRCLLPLSPNHSSVLTTAVQVFLPETSVLRGFCGACPTFSTSFYNSLAGSFHSFNADAPWKSLAPLSSHTCSQGQSHEPHSQLTPHAENPHLYSGPRSPSSTPDPYFPSAYRHLHLAVWNTSQTQHVQNHSLLLNIQDDSKATEHLQKVTIPWDFSLWSQIQNSGFAPPLPPSLEGMKTALGLPWAISTTDSESATSDHCPVTQVVRAKRL